MDENDDFEEMILWDHADARDRRWSRNLRRPMKDAWILWVTLGGMAALLWWIAC